MLVLITVFYIGSVVNPVGHLRGLPISIVNEDGGASIGPRQVDFGAELQSGLTRSRTVSTLLALTPERLQAAESRMDHNGSYATVVIPPDFTASLLSMTGPRCPRRRPPANPRSSCLPTSGPGPRRPAGSRRPRPAIARASHRIGQHLLATSHQAPQAGTVTAALLADPITSQTSTTGRCRRTQRSD